MQRFFFVFSMLFSLPCFAAPQIVVSLKPIQGLVASITEGVAEPQVLLPDGASEHTFQLKPSTLKAIHNADLIIWIGPELESFMSKAVTLKPEKVMTLIDLPRMQRLPLRHSRDWEQEDDQHDHHHDTDPHIWLSIANAKIMVDAITQRLNTIDPLNKTIYENNRIKTIDRLNTLFIDIKTQLKESLSQPFLVQHDGYQYFEREFGLNAKGAIMLNPEVPLSAKMVQTIKKRIQKEQIQCLFTEPELNSTAINNHLRSLSLRFAQLDPLGIAQKPGKDCYFDTLSVLAHTLKSCLSENK